MMISEFHLTILLNIGDENLIMGQNFLVKMFEEYFTIDLNNDKIGKQKFKESVRNSKQFTWCPVPYLESIDERDGLFVSQRFWEILELLWYTPVGVKIVRGPGWYKIAYSSQVIVKANWAPNHRSKFCLTTPMVVLRRTFFMNSIDHMPLVHAETDELLGIMTVDWKNSDYWGYIQEKHGIDKVMKWLPGVKNSQRDLYEVEMFRYLYRSDYAYSRRKFYFRYETNCLKVMTNLGIGTIFGEMDLDDYKHKFEHWIFIGWQTVEILDRMFDFYRDRKSVV
jgi:hypothetical protein